ncbi:MAG: membrane protein of unknown function [Promethearchaeota archaeon]|nr:MAG: membrane protein of unknown function [Candidatus Lokiarchaeota archaeon]
MGREYGIAGFIIGLIGIVLTLLDLGIVFFTDRLLYGYFNIFILILTGIGIIVSAIGVTVDLAKGFGIAGVVISLVGFVLTIIVLYLIFVSVYI